jgi:hypothetical protein
VPLPEPPAVRAFYVRFKIGNVLMLDKSIIPARGGNYAQLQIALTKRFQDELTHCMFHDLVIRDSLEELLPVFCDLNEFHNSESRPFLITAPAPPALPAPPPSILESVCAWAGIFKSQHPISPLFLITLSFGTIQILR